jgi:AmmeMemoRadiSam system protein B
LTPTTEQLYPKLRAVEAHPIVQNGRQSILLRDPLQLSDRTLVVPQPLHMVLAMCDGTRENAAAVSASLAVRHGLRIPPEIVEQLLSALDAACLLDNGTYRRAWEKALDDYRSAPYRPPTSAGQSYPDDVRALESLLDGYLGQPGTEPDEPSSESAPIRGLVSPHIDFARGGPVYARIWQKAADAARAADLALILGTNHAAGVHPDGVHPAGSTEMLTLTRQHYATPYGVLPTASDVVGALAEALGEAPLFAGELHHRSEHSIELAAVWLQHARGGEPCDVVPVLCGSFRECILGEKPADQDLTIQTFVDAFKRAAEGRQVLVIAAADLAHVGPAFGGRPVDMIGRARLQAADEALIERMNQGSAEGFLSEIQRVGDRNNVCGVPPIYLALRLLEPVQGELVAYDRCPADRQGTSLVSICGVAWR